MAEFDTFANQLLEEAKRFLEKAREAPNEKSEAANLHAALLLSCCALEAHVNAVAEEFSGSNELSAHERGLLLEKEAKLKDGQFQVVDALKMTRLEERIEFLHAKFSGKPVDRSLPWWAGIRAAIDLRNQLTHAKAIPAISQSAVRVAVQSIIDALDALYRAIYKKKFPPSTQGLNSDLTF